MTRGRAGLLLVTLVVPVALGSNLSLAARAPAPATAGEASQVGRAVLFVLPGMSFAQAMTVPEFRQLARAGGAGLMTTAVPRGGDGRGSSRYLTIGAGSPIADRGSSERALMMQALGATGVEDCAVSAFQPEADPADRLDLMVLTADGGGPCAQTRPTPPDPAHPPAGIDVIALAGSPDELGRGVRAHVERLPAVPTFVMVLVPLPSPAMDAAGDEVTPLIVARGLPAGLFPANGPMHGLTSDSTRQPGLVANTDVAPTVLDAFGVAAPAEMDGQPVRVAGDAPFGLYAKQMDVRRIRFPVQMLELAVVVLAGIAAIAGLIWVNARRRISARAAAALRFMALAGAALPVVVLAGGLLPRFTYGVVVPYVLLAPVALAALAAFVRFPGPCPPLRFIGMVGLVFIAGDLLTGSHALRLPLEGGVLFDGVRFFGLPNFGISPLLASALFVAAGLSLGWGTALLAGAGLLAGWPSLGADIGGSITLFVAAGLWFAIRHDGGTVRPSGLAIAALFAVAGLGAVLAANRFLAAKPTHGTRFVERAAGSLGTFLSTIVDRLGVGVRLVASDVAVLIPLLGLFVLFWLTVRRPGCLAIGLADDRWRTAIVVLIVAALVSYVVNDTGSTAASPAFLYAMVGILVPTLDAFAGRPSRATPPGPLADAPGPQRAPNGVER